MAAETAGVPKLITWAPFPSTNVSVSPFGGKIEVALRMAGIDYSVEAGDPTNSKLFVKQTACSPFESPAQTCSISFT